MKKLLLIALIVLSCLAFASCDIVNQFVPNDQGGSAGGSGNDGTDNNGGENSELPISEAEWVAAMSVTNYTFDYTYRNGSTGPYDESGEAITVIDKYKYTDTAIWSESNYYEEWYQIDIDGKAIDLFWNYDENQFEVWAFGYDYTASTLADNAFLSRLTDLSVLYKNLQYIGDDTYKAEHYIDGIEHSSYEVVIKNGKVEQLVVTRELPEVQLTQEKRFYDVGTTVIEIPEYRPLRRFTVTKDEWLNAMNKVNFSVFAYECSDIDYSMNFIYEKKYTEDIVYDNNRFNGYITYTTKVDGQIYNIIFSTLYANSPHIALPNNEETKVATTLGEALKDIIDIDWNSFYDSLEFDSYSYGYSCEYSDSNNVAYSFYFQFEDGKIVTASIISDANTDNYVKVDIDTFGETVIEMPEYTLNTIADVITEEEFLASFDNVNYSAFSGESTQLDNGEYESVTLFYATYSEDAANVGSYGKDNSYQVKIDGQIYNIIYTNGRYFAFPDNESTKIAPTLGEFLLANIEVDVNAIYDALMYDMFNNSFVYIHIASDGTICIFDFRFIDGKLSDIYIETESPDANSSIFTDIVNIGTTVVELPKYTIA